MFSLLSDDLRRNPYAMYDVMRRTSPLLHDPSVDLWMIFDYQGVKRALNDAVSFSSSVVPPGGKAPEWLVFLDPPRHTKLRTIIMRAFTPQAIASLEPRIASISRDLLNKAETHDSIDLVADYSGLLPTIVIAEMLGIPVQDREKFIHWSRIIVNLSYSMAGGEHAARAAREHAAIKPEMEQYISELLEQRRHVPKDDLFSHLVQAEVDGEHLSDADILGFFQLLLSAATETTTNLITNAVLCFSENPHQLRKLKASPELMPLAIEEVLRYRSPAQIAFRQTKRDVEMHGQKIPAGKFVLAMIGSANRDSKEFPNASEFDILRTPNPHLAFGHGIHFCLGSALARLQTRIALTDLYFRLLSVEVIDNQRWKPRQALHVHGPASLPVHLGTPVGALAPRRFGRLLHHGSAH